MRHPHHKIYEESWEDHFSQTKKESRQERKQKSANDRSKFKKTDRMKNEIIRLKNMEEAKALIDSMPGVAKKGRVTMIRSQEFHLLMDGKTEIARLRGAMKLETEEDKNIIVVGDEVIALLDSDGIYSVEAILPRRSVLCRQDNLNRIKRHLIASNIDQVCITTSIVNPHLRVPIIDRYLIAAWKGNIHPILLINKIDLLENAESDERELLDIVQSTYESLGVLVLQVSVKSGEGLDQLKELMKNKVSVFSGQSGSGKSSLINMLLGTSLKTAKTVDRTRKGSHTTTFTQMLPILSGGMCIDTPGIRSFGIWDLSKEDIRMGFPEFQTIETVCQFNNCWHRGEEGCMVEKEVEKENSSISPLRYNSYLSLLEEIEQERKRR